MVPAPCRCCWEGCDQRELLFPVSFFPWHFQFPSQEPLSVICFAFTLELISWDHLAQMLRAALPTGCPSGGGVEWLHCLYPEVLWVQGGWRLSRSASSPDAGAYFTLHMTCWLPIKRDSVMVAEGAETPWGLSLSFLQRVQAGRSEWTPEGLFSVHGGHRWSDNNVSKSKYR